MEEESTRSELRKAIMMSKSGKAPGGDYAEVDMLKWGIRAGLLPVLTNLYNGCLKLGVFPKPWKKGVIRVLLKSTDKDPTSTGSYRPICLLSVLSKALERLIKYNLRTIITQADYSSDRQYGFRSKRSTVDAIAKVREMLRVQARIWY